MKHKNYKIFAALIIFLLIISMIDRKYWAPKRLLHSTWQTYGSVDYAKTGIDLISYNKFAFSSDTLCFNDTSKFLLRHCIFGSLWISDLEKTYTARYTKFKGSDLWH
jgi:hypothetical protein